MTRSSITNKHALHILVIYIDRQVIIRHAGDGTEREAGWVLFKRKCVSRYPIPFGRSFAGVAAVSAYALAWGPLPPAGRTTGRYLASTSGGNIGGPGSPSGAAIEHWVHAAPRSVVQRRCGDEQNDYRRSGDVTIGKHAHHGDVDVVDDCT